jgi:hypothetical protein
MNITRAYIKCKLAHEKRGIVSVAHSIGVSAGSLSDYLFRGRVLKELEMKKIMNYFKEDSDKVNEL